MLPATISIYCLFCICGNEYHSVKYSKYLNKNKRSVNDHINEIQLASIISYNTCLQFSQ